MDKKPYSGLSAEIISFDAASIETGLVAESGCRLGSVQYYNEDEYGAQLPMGVCWVAASNTYSLDWLDPKGDYIP